MSAPSSVAHYRVTAKLGEGGMGEVWRATDTKLGRDVALKILPDQFAGDIDRLARFSREAHVLASLNHPNIAGIYGVEDHALVLELVEGPTLAERMAQGPIVPEEALPIIEQLISGIEYAHERSIVHRDLKPANIKLRPDGRLKILDFGLARVFTSEVASGHPEFSSTLTAGETSAGSILGTARYLSPEQARGCVVDARADIWAFGVILYEMLTGTELFAADTVSDTLAAVLRQNIDLTGVPRQFARLVGSCLARDVQQRLRHIGDARFLIDDAPVAIPAATSSHRPARYWLMVSL
jgi:serine/threonine protein kinase